MLGALVAGLIGATVAIVITIRQETKRRDVLRAMIAAKLANIKHGTNQHTPEDTEISISSAAKMLNVSSDAVYDAKTVLKKGTAEEIAAVDRGDAKARLHDGSAKPVGGRSFRPPREWRFARPRAHVSACHRVSSDLRK